MSGRSDLAEKEYRHAQALFRAAGDEESAAHLHNRIAMAAVQQGDFERAERLSAEALELDRRRGHRRDEAIALSALGNVALARGDRDEGVRLMHESAALAEEVGFVWWRGVTLGNLAEWLVDHGDADEAERALLASVEVIAGLGDRVNMPFALATAARVAALRGDAYRAGTYWGALQAAEEREPSPAWSGSRAEHEAALAEIAGPEFERGCECGRELSLSEALDSVRTPVD